jgi:hypothetical protein
MCLGFAKLSAVQEEIGTNRQLVFFVLVLF